MPFSLASWRNLNPIQGHRLPLPTLTAIASSLVFIFPLSAAAAGSHFCRFGTPAFPYSVLQSCATTGPLVLGDKRLTLNGSDASLYQLPDTGSGFIEFSWQENPASDGYLNDIWSVKVDFNPDIVAEGAASPVSGTFKYTLEILDQDWMFATVDLDSIKSESSPQLDGKVVVQKLLPGGYLAPDDPLISINGSNVNPVAFAGDFTSIAVTDTYEVTAGSIGAMYLNSFQNTFTQQPSGGNIPPETAVPGPLPLLGISAAFAMARRLRRRRPGSPAH